MNELFSIAKRLHNALAIYNGAGYALGWKTAKIDALLDESKRVIEATPPAAQRQWIGLTDEEIDSVQRQYIQQMMPGSRHFARAIESKLKEKNS